MNKLVIGDALDTRILLVEGFNICVIHDVKTRVYDALPNAYYMQPLYPPRDMIDRYLTHLDRQEFDLEYHNYLDESKAAQLCIAGILYGLANNRRMSLVRYLLQYTAKDKIDIAHNSQVYVMLPFLESLGEYLRVRYNVEWMDIPTYSRRYLKVIDKPFKSGELNKEAYIALMDEFKEEFGFKSEEDYFNAPALDDEDTDKGRIGNLMNDSLTEYLRYKLIQINEESGLEKEDLKDEVDGRTFSDLRVE